MAIDPVIGAALIRGGTSLLGGLFGGKKKVNTHGQNLDAMTGRAKGARVAGERFNFNPLTLLASGGGFPGVQTGGAAPLSSAQIIAGTLGDVAMEATGINDALEEERERAELERLKRENEVLNAGGAGSVAARTVNRAGVQTPRAREAAPVAVNPTLAADLDGQAAASRDKGDPRRAVTVEPIKSSAGFNTIDTRFGSVGYLTFDGDEPADLWEIIGQAPVMLPQMMSGPTVTSKDVPVPTFEELDAEQREREKKKAKPFNPWRGFD